MKTENLSLAEASIAWEAIKSEMRSPKEITKVMTVSFSTLNYNSTFEMIERSA